MRRGLEPVEGRPTAVPRRDGPVGSSGLPSAFMLICNDD